MGMGKSESIREKVCICREWGEGGGGEGGEGGRREREKMRQ